ncbi:hypothetical protein JXA47_06780 [Candidatus Sumerlaeota bacterium]|nr:hypothetical protein [Candidatus Sumerlaeota bacterium]
MTELHWRGLQVWPGVAGEAEEVIASLTSRGAPDEALMMPGCGGWGRGRGGGRGRRHRGWCWGWQSAGGGVGEETIGERTSRE